MAGEAHAPLAQRLLGVVDEAERDVGLDLVEQPDEIDGDPSGGGRGGGRLGGERGHAHVRGRRGGRGRPRRGRMWRSGRGPALWLFGASGGLRRGHGLGGGRSRRGP